jgi:hypothetical protein
MVLVLTITVVIGVKPGVAVAEQHVLRTIQIKVEDDDGLSTHRRGLVIRRQEAVTAIVIEKRRLRCNQVQIAIIFQIEESCSRGLVRAFRL